MHFVDGNRAGTVVVPPFRNLYWDMEMVRNIVMEGEEEEEERTDSHIDSCLDYMDIVVVVVVAVVQDCHCSLDNQSRTVLHNFGD